MTLPDIPPSGGFAEFIRQSIVYILAPAVPMIGTLVAIVLRKKRPRDGAQDAVFEASTAQIADLRAQNRALSTENDALRSSRGDFEAQAIRSQAAQEVARAAAKAAADALARTAADCASVRLKAEQAIRYNFVLRGELAKNGLAIPPDPADMVPTP